MKKNSQGMYVLTVVIMIFLLVLAGCNSSSNKGTDKGTETNAPTSTTEEDPNKIDISEEVEIKFHVLGEKPEDYDEVYAEVNKLAKRDLNATVEVTYIPWGDYEQKYPLLFASGEILDLVYAASWTNYVGEANKGAFMEITEEMIKKYMPLSYQSMPQEAWDQSKVDGKIYMIPAENYLLGKRVVLIRGDLREKYNLPELKTTDDYIKYLETIAENETDLLAFNLASNETLGKTIVSYSNKHEYEEVAGALFGVYYDVTEPSGDVFFKTDDPKYLEYLKEMKRLNDKGVWSKNVLSNNTISQDSFLGGRSASHIHNIYSITNTYNDVMENNPAYKPEVYDVNPGKKFIIVPFTNDGAVIGATSKNVERSLMFLDKMKYDRDYYDLTWYGIEGKHWEAVGDDKMIRLPEGINNFGSGNICCAGPLERLSEDAPDFRIDIFNEWKENDLVTPDLVGFNFNVEKVQNEIAAISNVTNTYTLPLEFGMINDVEQGLADLKERYKEAGIDKVMAEVRAQVAEFREARKN